MSNICWISALHVIMKRDRYIIHPAAYDEDYTPRFHSDMHHPQVLWQVSLFVGTGPHAFGSRGISRTLHVHHRYFSQLQGVTKMDDPLSSVEEWSRKAFEIQRPQVAASLLTTRWVLPRTQPCIHHKNVLHLIVYSIKPVCDEDFQKMFSLSVS